MVDDTRDQFLAWIEGSTTIPQDRRAHLLDSLDEDATRLPASLRFSIPGCDLVTFAHAARLVRRLDAQGLLADPDSVAASLRAVPPCILGDQARVVEELLRADGVVGADGGSEPDPLAGTGQVPASST